MDIRQLIIEVGRGCNMHCAHCLRGEAEEAEVKMEDVISLLNQVENIDEITFTGGEPTLYVDKIVEIIDYIMDNEIPTCGFYIASNGIIKSKKLMFKLAEFYEYCDGDLEGYNCNYDVSKDIWHEEQAGYRNNELGWLRAFSFVKYRDEGKSETKYLITEGRAAENGFGHRMLDTDKKFYMEDDETVELVYLNALGYLLPDCDYSYETQREMKPYHVDEMPLEEIIEKFNKEEAA
jgi:hypothetical protein